MFRSLKLFSLFNVDIKVHWSWLLLFILFIDFADPINEILISTLTVVMIFTIVLIHEFGHIFAGRKYGLNTSKVILSFLGGAAIMDEGLDKLEPKKALWVAFAGPLTNLIMFFALLPFVNIVFSGETIDVEAVNSWQLFYLLGLVMNAIMFIFNLLPIFPMDGGRLLRSTLELFNVKRSFEISIRVTQVFCIIIFGLGIYLGSFTMPLIGVLFFVTSIFEMNKKKEDDEFEKTKVETTNDIKRKIDWEFNSKNMSRVEKLVFLSTLEIKSYETNSVRVINHIKEICDEYRENIERTGD